MADVLITKLVWPRDINAHARERRWLLISPRCNENYSYKSLLREVTL